MKTLVYLLAISALFLSSCSSTHYAGSTYDDVYYSSKDASTPKVVKEEPVSNTTSDTEVNEYSNVTSENSESEERVEYYSEEDTTSELSYSNSETYYDPEGKTYVTNNYYYDDEDYYDYEYSARLRRFHGYGPYTSFGYYDSYYTNYYWYTYDPFYWGTSIYVGYGWGWPYSYYYRPYYWDWGWGYHHWGWGYHDYGYGYGHGGYWGGYHDGYWDGYHDGYYGDDYYYNSYDGNKRYYGHRGSDYSNGSTNGRGNSPYSSKKSDRLASFGEKYDRAITAEKATISAPSTGVKTMSVSKTSSSATPVSDISKTNATSPLNKPTTDLKSSGVAKTDANIGNPVEKTKTPVNNGSVMSKDIKTSPVDAPKYADPKMVKTYSGDKSSGVNKATNNKPVDKKYSHPGNYNKYYAPKNPNSSGSKEKYNTEPQYTKPKSYTSPSYSEPKSNQYYSRPKSYSTPANNDPKSNSNPSSYSKPKSYSSPSNSSSRSNNNNSYSTPKSYSSPSNSRSYSSPSSSRSYSSPSSSSRSSYSSPSRSSSSGSSSRSSSSSSSSSGHRR